MSAKKSPDSSTTPVTTIHGSSQQIADAGPAADSLAQGAPTPPPQEQPADAVYPEGLRKWLLVLSIFASVFLIALVSRTMHGVCRFWYGPR